MSVGNTWWTCTRSRQITCKIQFPLAIQFSFSVASTPVCETRRKPRTCLPDMLTGFEICFSVHCTCHSGTRRSGTEIVFVLFPCALVYQRHSLCINRKGQAINYKVKHMQIKFEYQRCLFYANTLFQSHQSISQTAFCGLTGTCKPRFLATCFSLLPAFAFLCARM